MCAASQKKNQVVKSGGASQQRAGEGCLQTASSSGPDQPQPRPSDVCVPSLMKKFWYLGETLLSAEQTLPPLCPRPLGQSHRHPAIPSDRWQAASLLSASEGPESPTHSHDSLEIFT